MTLDEVAAELGLSPTKVWKIEKAALRKLRPLMAGWHREEGRQVDSPRRMLELGREGLE